MPTFGLIPLEILEKNKSWTYGQFTYLEKSSELSAFAAKRAFKKGDKVVAISKHFKSPLCQIFGCQHFTQKEVKEMRDFDVKPAFTSFIVWPSKSAPVIQAS